MPMPIPSEPLGSGLDFSGIRYGNRAKRFEESSKRAREILTEKLQVPAYPIPSVHVTV